MLHGIEPSDATSSHCTDGDQIRFKFQVQRLMGTRDGVNCGTVGQHSVTVVTVGSVW